MIGVSGMDRCLFRQDTDSINSCKATCRFIQGVKCVSCVCEQDYRLVEVPQMASVPVDVSVNLQEKLNPVTDVLSRISKLVCEDLDKAVYAVVSHNKEGLDICKLAFLFMCMTNKHVLFALTYVVSAQVLLKTRDQRLLLCQVQPPRLIQQERRALFNVKIIILIRLFTQHYFCRCWLIGN